MFWETMSWGTVIAAVVAAGLTYLFTKKREHEAEWRKLKFAQYQEFLLALSGIVEGRETKEAHLRYVDASNSMNLSASIPVLRALRDYQVFNSTNSKPSDSIEEHDRLLGVLIRMMRDDMFAGGGKAGNFQFRLITTPRAWQEDPERSKSTPAQ